MQQRTKIRRLSLATVAGVLAFAAAGQEPSEPATQPEFAARLFVSDKLVLNVYSEPAQAGERIATIETGDAVDELERAQGFVRVRLSDGREGWVGANYLTDEPPAAVRLRELQRGQKAPAPDRKSQEEITRLRKQNAALESELAALKKSSPAPAAAASEDADSFDDFDDAPTAAQTEAAPESSAYETWLIALLAAAIAGLIGFAAGYQMLARRVRAKFGGLKVYQ